MKLTGPERYDLSIIVVEGGRCSYKLRCADGANKFTGLAANKLPKLYIISIDRKPIYVGVTRQTMGSRFSLGWSASGKKGYHGYAFRRESAEAALHIWAHENAGDTKNLDVETLEAEVVFLIRLAGQWPKFQTEIHFHPSTEIHRELARDIVATYPALSGFGSL